MKGYLIGKNKIKHHPSIIHPSIHPSYIHPSIHAHIHPSIHNNYTSTYTDLLLLPSFILVLLLQFFFFYFYFYFFDSSSSSSSTTSSSILLSSSSLPLPLPLPLLMQLSRLIGFHSPLLSMDCDCHWSPDDLHLRYQYISDFFIALAYFSIPLELIYFVKKSAVFPYRWVLVQFGAFIVLCGATHLINLWTLSAAHSPLVATVMTVSKVLTAVVSCATALMLVHIIPDLLSVKTRELFLKNKAAELDREMGIIRTQEETGRSVRMLTQEIRSTLDRHTILNTTMVELGKALALEECGLWMPTRKGTELKLTHTLLLEKQQQKNKNGGGYGGGGGGRTAPSRHLTVPLSHATVKQVLGSRRAVSLPSDSPLAVMTRPDGAVKYAVAGDAVAMRVPLLHLNNFRIVCDLEPSVAAARCSAPFALMVLVLPSNSARRWHVHELELVEVVAEQVNVQTYFASEGTTSPNPTLRILWNFVVRTFSVPLFSVSPSALLC
jgi:hypothetical protein